jgi:uncharacterized protein YgiM (DUF1202 family)
VENKTNYNKQFNKEPRGQRAEDSPVDEKTNIEPENQEQKNAIVSNCTGLNIRKEPTVNSEVACIVYKGTKLIIGETKDGWVEVYNKQGTEIEGYVMMEYIKGV